jgi:predicted GNAT family N-acyltransferase
MSLQWKIKPFEELSVHELYDLLRLRSEIFVVEQNCVYLDLDGKDKGSTLINMVGKQWRTLVYLNPELVLIMLL